MLARLHMSVLISHAKFHPSSRSSFSRNYYVVGIGGQVDGWLDGWVEGYDRLGIRLNSALTGIQFGWSWD